MTLPPDPPFMVQPTFDIKADLFPLPSELNGRYEHTHFVEDNLLESYILQRLEFWQQGTSERRVVQTDDPEGLAKTLWQIFGIYASEYPQLLTQTENEIHLKYLGLCLLATPLESPMIIRENATPLGEKVAAWLERQHGITRLLDALCLSCQEDIVIMRDLGEMHVAEALSVCFPSGWNPREKLLGDFGFIHAPIADNSRLIKSGPNVMKALFTRGPFIRFSWGLTLNPSLDNHPDSPKLVVDDTLLENPAALARHTFLRMERQTTKAFPEYGRGLFSIRVYVTPLLERLQKEPELRGRLVELLRSVKPEVLAYKGMSRITLPLLKWLEGDNCVTG